MALSIFSSAIVPEVLGEDNYAHWSLCMKNYLLAQDLWDIIEGTTKPPNQEDDAVKFNTWRKQNATALHAIQISCTADVLSDIKGTSSAKIAWDTLAEIKNSKSLYSKNNKSLARTATDVENDHRDRGHVELYMALYRGNWDAAKKNLDRRPELVNAKISLWGLTPLCTAINAGHARIVEELLELVPENELEMQNDFGFTALDDAAGFDNIRIAECIVRKNKKLLSLISRYKCIPAVKAIYDGNIEMARYLYSLTPLEDLMPQKSTNGATLITQSIKSRNFDIALHLLPRCPRLALAEDVEGNTPVYALACIPSAFPSGSSLVFWKRWIYSRIRIQPATNEIRVNIQNQEKSQSHQLKTTKSGLALFDRVVLNLLNILGIQQLYEMKSVHCQSHELLRLMCKEISISNSVSVKVAATIFHAIREGISEFIIDILKAAPELVWIENEVIRNIFMYAVLHRQAKIFNLIRGIYVKNQIANRRDRFGNNMLHMAGMLETSTKLNGIPGAALQMQRELQWFKEVESIGNPKLKEDLNNEGLRPRELFKKNHTKMVEDGEKWMKDTATSCTVVGALIVTIMFAAAFTVPGGYDEASSVPMFLNAKTYKLFMVSDALSLFSSSTSVLMFMGILTSRYEEDDFLKSLPTKMIIGLSALFFSFATMMIAFSAGLLIMLQGQSWIVIPAICFASIPVTLFVWLQFPLLVEMVSSTYGPGIFDKKVKNWWPAPMDDRRFT